MNPADTTSTGSAPALSIIVLTMGDRPRELDALIDSLAAEPSYEGVLVGNGVAPPAYPGWRAFELDENVGIAGGRAFGAKQAHGRLLVFLDDDATNLTTDLLAATTAAFADDPALGAIAMRVVVEGTNHSLSEWQPRIRGRKQHTAGDVTAFSGAAHAVRADVYEAVGGYPDNFWYAHEETDLAWRILDAGYRIAYRPDLTVSHPATTPSRHNQHLWFSARNRLWLARRHLPLPVGLLYVAIWLAIQLVRCRSYREIRGVIAGTVAGARTSPGRRSPMSWKTVAHMTRLGRPPLI